VDAVVVGGGVVGAACALGLAREGADVTLIERSELAAGASGRNHGLVLSPTDPALLPMAEATLGVYREVAEDQPVPFRLDPDPIGFLVVAGDEEAQRASGRAEAEAARACGVQVEHVDGMSLRDLEPALAPNLAEGWLLEDGRRLDPAALTVSLALLAASAGARIRRHLAARSLRTSGGRVVGVATDEGPIDADVVVVAGGPDSGALLRPIGVDLPSVGARGWLVHMGGAAHGPRRIVERAGWHPLPDQEALPPSRMDALAGGGRGPDVGTLVHPTVDGSFLAGGSRQGAAEPEDPAVPVSIARLAVELLPALAEAPVLGTWWGIRPMSPDGRPIVGPVGDGVLVATGHGSQGVILAGGTGLLVAALAAGREPSLDATPFHPGRFGVTPV
jgi:glycine/D-amino acid oxidase-like deaminating enzyme